MMFDLTSLEKIKHQNALVIFAIILVCFLFPYLLFFLIDKTFLFNEDLIKTSLLTLAIGSSVFGMYFTILLVFLQLSIMIDKILKKENSYDINIDSKYKTPLLNTILGLILLYTFVTYQYLFNNKNEGLDGILKLSKTIVLSTTLVLSGLMSSIIELIIRPSENLYFYLKKKLRK